jgi:hypothetical protein
MSLSQRKRKSFRIGPHHWHTNSQPQNRRLRYYRGMGTRRRATLRRGTWGPGLTSELHHILCLQALGALSDGEFHSIAFTQRLEASGLNCRVVDENIVSRCALNKSIAFFVVKPLHCTLFFHFSSCNQSCPAGRYRIPNGNGWRLLAGSRLATPRPVQESAAGVDNAAQTPDRVSSTIHR